MEFPKYPKNPLHLLAGEDLPALISPLKMNN